MPVEYSGITAEHMAVRTAVGLFDVSHMGDIQFRGPGSLAAIQALKAFRDHCVGDGVHGHVGREGVGNTCRSRRHGDANVAHITGRGHITAADAHQWRDLVLKHGRHRIVRIGTSAFGRPCLVTTTLQGNPLASAVRMKSWCSTSSMAERVMRAMKPICTAASVNAGSTMQCHHPEKSTPIGT